MRKFAVISLLISIFNISVYAGNKIVNPIPRVTFGAEWSYIGTLPYKTHFNFFSTEGHRQNINKNHRGYFNNAEVLFHIGYNFNSNWNLALYCGMTGMADIHNAVPISLRATYAFGKNPADDRWLAFMDLGSGVSIKRQPQEFYAAKIGGGYRISLSRNTKLDFIAAYRLSFTHPTIIHDDNEIELKWINSSEALLSSFCIGMSLTF